MTNLVLASGQITNHDESRLPWSSPRTAGRRSCEWHWPLRPTTAAASHYPAVAVAIVRVIAESATALARHKAGGL